MSAAPNTPLSRLLLVAFAMIPLLLATPQAQADDKKRRKRVGKQATVK